MIHCLWQYNKLQAAHAPRSGAAARYSALAHLRPGQPAYDALEEKADAIKVPASSYGPYSLQTEQVYSEHNVGAGDCPGWESLPEDSLTSFRNSNIDGSALFQVKNHPALNPGALERGSKI